MGRGEGSALGEGEREGDLGKRSKGLGDLGGDPAGVESGDNSLISQYSKRMSGVDCLLLTVSSSSSLTSRTFLTQILVIMLLAVVTNLGGVKLLLGGVRPLRLGGVKLSLFINLLSAVLFTPMSGIEGFLSVAESLLL